MSGTISKWEADRALVALNHRLLDELALERERTRVALASYQVAADSLHPDVATIELRSLLKRLGQDAEKQVKEVGKKKSQPTTTYCQVRSIRVE